LSATSTADPGRTGGRGAKAPRPRVSFTTGLLIKTGLLAVANALAVWTFSRAVEQKAWGIAAVIVATTLALDFVYLTKRAIPGKYLFPGSVFLIIFYLYPVAYTVQTSFTNYGGSNLLSKPAAVERIISTSVEPQSGAFSMEVLADPAGALTYVFVNENGDRFLAGPTSLTPLDTSTAVIDEDNNLQSIGDKKRLRLGQLRTREKEILAFSSTVDGNKVTPDSLSSAAALKPRLAYDAKTDRITDVVDGYVYAPKDGTFQAISADVPDDRRSLFPGFKANLGFRNYTAVLSDPDVRGPFFRVFVWNVAFALGTVLFTVAVGMLLAMALNHPKVRGVRFFRQMLFIPYALPSFMMTLVWSQGLLNTKFGYINRLLGIEVAWFDKPWTARAMILLINTWLGFPYMFLLCTGLLQAIPADFKEAASVDGATGWQTFRRITLPNLLIGLSPMLIAGFAFNFNNFGPIYLTTQGGPPIPGARTIAGQTDILVTYTYKLAFASGKGSQYGLASAINVLIFFIVGLISAISFRNTKAFKETK
jgi:arabinogalactan oligomer / maltooligosaccharide transport system permease protein